MKESLLQPKRKLKQFGMLQIKINKNDFTADLARSLISFYDDLVPLTYSSSPESV